MKKRPDKIFQTYGAAFAGAVGEALNGIRPNFPVFHDSESDDQPTKKDRNPFRPAWESFFRHLQKVTSGDLRAAADTFIASWPKCPATGAVILDPDGQELVERLLELKLLGDTPAHLYDAARLLLSEVERPPIRTAPEVARLVAPAFGVLFCRASSDSHGGAKTLTWREEFCEATGKRAGRWVPFDKADTARLCDVLSKTLGQRKNEIFDRANKAPDDSDEKKRLLEIAAEFGRLAKWCGSQANMEATILTLAAANEVPGDRFDANPDLLGTPGGVVDLRNGRLIDADPRQLMTRQTSVYPDFDRPPELFTKFLNEITQGNKEIQEFLLDELAFGISGYRTRRITFLQGPGLNGKSTLVETIARVLGSYATQIQPAVLSSAPGDQSEKKFALASLFGRRFGYQSEFPKDSGLDVATLKRLTGDATLGGRGLHQSAEERENHLSLFVSINPLPRLSETGQAERDRIMLVPIDFRPQKIDRTLPDRLAAEGEQLLGFLVQRFTRIFQNRLQPAEVPAIVKKKSGGWLSDCAPGRQLILNFVRRSAQGDDSVAILDITRLLEYMAGKEGGADRQAIRATASKSAISAILSGDLQATVDSSAERKRRPIKSQKMVSELTASAHFVRWIDERDVDDAETQEQAEEIRGLLDTLKTAWDEIDAELAEKRRKRTGERQEEYGSI